MQRCMDTKMEGKLDNPVSHHWSAKMQHLPLLQHFTQHPVKAYKSTLRPSAKARSSILCSLAQKCLKQVELTHCWSVLGFISRFRLLFSTCLKKKGNLTNSRQVPEMMLQKGLKDRARAAFHGPAKGVHQKTSALF